MVPRRDAAVGPAAEGRRPALKDEFCLMWLLPVHSTGPSYSCCGRQHGLAPIVEHLSNSKSGLWTTRMHYLSVFRRAF